MKHHNQPKEIYTITVTSLCDAQRRCTQKTIILRTAYTVPGSLCQKYGRDIKGVEMLVCMNVNFQSLARWNSHWRRRQEDSCEQAVTEALCTEKRFRHVHVLRSIVKKFWLKLNKTCYMPSPRHPVVCQCPCLMYKAKYKMSGRVLRLSNPWCMVQCH